MKQFFYIFNSLFSVFILLINCSQSNLAGGGTIETTNGVVGTIHNKENKPVPNVIVKIFPDDYDPVSDEPLDSNYIDTTDTSGEYSFENVTSGSYVIVARNADNSDNSLTGNITVNDDSLTTVSEIILKKPGLVKFNHFDADGYLFIPGTDIFSSVSDDGNVFLSGVPSGVLNTIIHVSASNDKRNILHNEIVVNEGGTVDIDNPLWNYKRQIVLNTTINGAGISGNVYGFPVLIRLNSGNFEFSQVMPDGKDILFVRNGQILPFEIERWNAVIQKAEIWVKVDTVYGNDSVQSITMRWGNPSVKKLSGFNPVFDTAGSFQGVWHMEGAQTDSVMDVTENGYHGYSPDSTNPLITGGVIGDCRKFDGKDDFIEMPNTAQSKLDFPQNGRYSVSAWVNYDSSDHKSYLIVSKGYEQYFLRLFSILSDLPLWEFVEFSKENNWQSSTGQALSRQWAFLTGVRDGERQILYCNGVAVDSIPSNWPQGVVRNVTNNLSIGKFLQEVEFPVNEGYSYFCGLIDEVRINSIALSPDWIRLCYMNQRIDDRLVVFK